MSSESPPLRVLRVDGDGKVLGGVVVDSATAVADLAGALSNDATDEPAQAAFLIALESVEADPKVDVAERRLNDLLATQQSVQRRLTGREFETPTFVPEDWRAPQGRPGVLVAEFRGRGHPPRGHVPARVALVSVKASPDELDGLVAELEDRLRRTTLRRPQQLFDLLNNLVDGRRLRGLATDDKKDTKGSEETLASLERRVPAWEEAFADGLDFSKAVLDEIDGDIKTLALMEPFLSAREQPDRVGLLRRLVRLKDAQTSRDAAGGLERAATILTSLVLVPTLVAGVYGANVAVPLEMQRAGWLAMIAFMVAGAVLTNLGLNATRIRYSTRTLHPSIPGAPRRDADREGRPQPLAFPDGGLAVRATYAFGLGASTALTARAGLFILQEAPRAQTTIAVLAVVLLLALAALACVMRSDARERPGVACWTHPVTFALAGIAAYAGIENLWCIAVPAALGGIALPASLTQESVRRRIKLDDTKAIENVAGSI